VSDAPDRLEQLAHRVRWLDRYRRKLAVLAALVLSPLAIAWLARDLNGDWTRLQLTLTAGVIAPVTWWIAELTFAWRAASWETEHAQLSRERGLPRAELLRRK
jgi:hypothetical protein